MTADFDLPNMLSHLLRRAHFMAEARFGETLGQKGLTSRQMALLVAIAQNPGATQNRLAETIALDANTLSDLIARMLKKKLIRRSRSDEDRRSYALWLQPSGEAILAQTALENDAYQDLIGQRLTRRERDQLTALLRKMIGL